MAVSGPLLRLLCREIKKLNLLSLGLGLARSCALTAVSLFLAPGLDRKANTVRQP
jgi:hypothetical protein